MTELNKPDWITQMEGILETLNEGVLIVDDCNNIIFLNECLAQMAGYGVAEVLGRPAAHFYAGDDRDFLMQQIARSEQVGRNRYEFYIPRRDGSRVPVVISARVVEDPDGRVFSVVTFTDISDQKHAEEKLREANTQLEKRAREIEAELVLANSVQQSLAPKCIRWGRVAVETAYFPVNSIGGDFGHVMPLDDGHLNLLVCDVSGHGISSALIANRIYSETMSLLERRVDAGEMLRQLNRFVVQQLRVSGFYFTMAIVRLTAHGARMSFAAGGHPPAIYLSRAGEARLLQARGTVLGMLDEAIPSDASEEFDLASGERVVLYTDGLTEAWNEHDEMLGMEGFTEIVRRHAALPLADMKQAILRDVEAFRHGPATDDISLVLLELQ
ncbi:MAG TPA: SpoIIE family protein phosphatase [Candidatus Acidoferrales bacterium]|nr:SpoIIE family protein phosphatase [Candidatus Acidoferrales bacterium]